MRLSISVLVAEQEAESRHVMALALTKSGYSLTCVTDGAAALAYLRCASPPVIVVAEDMLPEISGLQLAALLALKYATRPCYSVILLTADTHRALVQRSTDKALGAEALDILLKPFLVSALVMAVDIVAKRLQVDS